MQSRTGQTDFHAELGGRIRRWLAALACGSKRHPCALPPHPGGFELRIRALHLPSGGQRVPTGCREVFGAVPEALLHTEELQRSELPTLCLLCFTTHCALLRHSSMLLDFGQRHLQGLTHKTFSLSDSVTNRIMAEPNTARTQLPDFQHGG